MKIALIHDWLTGMRGGERVLEVFYRLFPQADIFTLFHFKNSVSELLESRCIQTSRLQKIIPRRINYRFFLPLFPSSIESFDLTPYDVLISTSHAVAKGAIPRSDALSICYCHTPMRYIWDQYDNYFSSPETPRFVRLISSITREYLQHWDKESSDRVDHFIANSRFVAKRIQNYYHRDSTVIHPPVNTSFYRPSGLASEDYYLIVSAINPYKKIDLAIDAFNKLGKRLVIIGSGKLLTAFQKKSNSNIEMLGYRNDEEVLKYYQNCKALIFPGTEDFGLTPIESQACGRPVIAYAAGGVLESVIEGISGHFFRESHPDSLAQAVLDFERMEFDPDVIRSRSLEYDSKVMLNQLRQYFISLGETAPLISDQNQC